MLTSKRASQEALRSKLHTKSADSLILCLAYQLSIALTTTCYFRAQYPPCALAGEGTIPRELLDNPEINEIDRRGLGGETSDIK